MQYFKIETIKDAIERLQNFSGNWILPTFVFAANNVGTEEAVDLAANLGTDQFLNRYFHGKRLEIPPTPRGNNLLRPRFKDIKWNQGEFANDYMIRQDTKMWGNLFSSRGYREMRLQGLVEGKNSVAQLTDNFQPRFEEEVPASFHFEDFMVWLFAFEGIPDEVNDWRALYDYLLNHELRLQEFKPPYRGRFELSAVDVPWPELTETRPSNREYLEGLAPKLLKFLESTANSDSEASSEAESTVLGADDPILAEITSAIDAGESLNFLLAGPPGTGKTRHARLIAQTLTDGDSSRSLFLQFHPAVSYDDFMEGFRPRRPESGTGIEYELAPRLFLKFAKAAAEDTDRTYVLVIDELNRGDVARIFGEALTYLESAYRGIEFTLPISGDKAKIPSNLIIIATGNPYDRSVTDLDNALLRRFWVVELEPDSSALRIALQKAGVDGDVIQRTVRLFEVLNEKFPHGFGHANFIRVRTIEDLSAVWSGRAKLALRRALFHDKKAFEATIVEISPLLVEPPAPTQETE